MLVHSIFLINVLFSLVFAQDSSTCLSQATCDRCLEASVTCAWCTDRAYDIKSPRCMPKNELIGYNCRPEFIQESKPLKQNIFRDESLSDFSKDSLTASQIRPQWVKLNLKKSEAQVVKMKFRPAKNYPLDLYYLMDLTWSMKDDKETLVQMGGSLAKALNNLTENSRLGFGSFADKPTMPYIMISAEELKNPCAVEKDVCEPTYLYKHQLSLTTDIGEFVKEVNQSKVTGNVDSPEGGLEALMQVLVCEDLIGWKEHARKIVVFATDAQMHMAGDGFLGGAVLRNDKLCHVTQKGEYTAALAQDYPSLEEIYHELARRKVNVIFAVTDGVFRYYQSMHQLMAELTRVGLLQSDSSNVLQLVEDGFKEFSRMITFHDDAPTDYIKIEYFTTCGGKHQVPVPTSSCDNVEIGKEYDFEMRIHLLESPSVVGVEKLTVKVEEASLNEFMLLDFELEWDCPCMREEIGEQNSYVCNEHGELKCGMCLCNDGFIGKACECNLKNYTSTRGLEMECKNPDMVDTFCSNEGECLCGECYCGKGRTGRYCECEMCTSKNDKVCNGHGSCDCGKCLCDEGWSGEDCDCATSSVSCFSPESSVQKVCSGHGNCECGGCHCNEGYMGIFCESQPGKNNSLCLYYEPCVHAKIRQRLGEKVTNYMDICSNEGIEYTHEFVGDLKGSDIRCLARLKYQDDICDFDFTYVIESQHQHTNLVIQDQQCPTPDYAMIGFWSTLIATLLIGIFGLLIWWLVTKAKDRREYALFEQQVAEMQVTQESPIYKGPKTEYRNPLYISKSKENVISL